MKRTVNYKMGALKRRYKTGRVDVEPGTFINKLTSQKAASKSTDKTDEKVAVMGLV